MPMLKKLSEGIGETWDHIAEGWRHLSQRASHALTRFSPSKSTKAEVQELAVRSAGWGMLACEVFDDDERVVVRLEVPGMEREDFDLQIVDDYMLVRGEKQIARESTEGGYHISECAYGRFERAIPIPGEVDSDNVKAYYKNGVLRVELPKLTPRQRRRIKVDVA